MTAPDIQMTDNTIDNSPAAAAEAARKHEEFFNVPEVTEIPKPPYNWLQRRLRRWLGINDDNFTISKTIQDKHEHLSSIIDTNVDGTRKAFAQVERAFEQSHERDRTMAEQLNVNTQLLRVIQTTNPQLGKAMTRYFAERRKQNLKLLEEQQQQEKEKREAELQQAAPLSIVEEAGDFPPEKMEALMNSIQPVDDSTLVPLDQHPEENGD